MNAENAGERAFGKYTILEELGRGGFGTVFRAVDTTLDRPVALKILEPLLMRDRDWVNRFRQEARLMARLDHPHIVPVYETGAHDGRLFLAMKLIDGPDLAGRIAVSGPFAWEDALNITGQIASALDYAHAEGLIHRDLKPSNILLANGSAVLTDFGLSRLAGGNTMSISLTGGVIGTPSYIPPEAWENQPVTGRADQYALACLVSEMLTGDVLFTGDTPPAIMMAHYQPPAFPGDWPAGVPEGIEEILAIGLARDPEGRFATCSELAAALRRLQSDALARPYGDLQRAVQAEEWATALELADQIRARVPDYRDVIALEQAAMTGLATEQKAAAAVQWREQAEAALAAGNFQVARTAALQWQALSEEPAAAEFLANLDRPSAPETEVVPVPPAAEKETPLPIDRPPVREPVARTPTGGTYRPAPAGNGGFKLPSWAWIAGLIGVGVLVIVGLNYLSNRDDSPDEAAAPEPTAEVEAEEPETVAEGVEGVESTAAEEEAVEEDMVEAPAAEETGPNIVESLAADPDLQIFLSALEEAFLIDLLIEGEDITLIAPTNTAFEALPEGTFDSLMADPEGALADVLLHHLVDRALSIDELILLDSTEAVHGDVINFKVVDDELILNDSAVVVRGNISASNGMIHVIDGVLLPQTDPMRGQGGTVTVQSRFAPTTLNPYLSGQIKDVDPAAGVLEPLMSIDDAGDLVPRLVEEVPTVANGGHSEDLMSLVYRLREGVFWGDGTPFTAADVVFTYEYCVNPDTGCVQIDLFDEIARVTAVDDVTVEIVFNQPTAYPYGPFVTAFSPILQADQFSGCVGSAAQACEAENFFPVGTGPFIVADFEPDGNAAFVANEFYRDSDKPFFDELLWFGGGDDQAAAEAVLLNGEIDFSLDLQIDHQELEVLIEAGSGEAVTAFDTSVELLMVNLTNPDPALGTNRSEYLDGSNPHPFLNDVRVRRALSLAIDRQVIVDEAYGRFGRPVCNVIAAPPAVVSTANDGCLQQDIELARQFLAEAGFVDQNGDGFVDLPDGSPLTVVFQTSIRPEREDTAQLLEMWWREIGIRTEVEIINPGTFFGDINSDDFLGRFYADVEMFAYGALAISGLQDYLENWTCGNIPGAANNWFGPNVPRYCSPEYDALYDELTRTADPTRRAELIKQMNDLLVQDAVLIPLVHRGLVSGHAGSMRGITVNGWDSNLWNVADWSREE